VSVHYVDDIDGSADAGPVDFSLDGKKYTIDLSDANTARLREVLAPFVNAARRPGGSARRSGSDGGARSGGGSSRSREQTQEMRGWLRDDGYTIKARGRVPTELVAAYEMRSPAAALSDRSAALETSRIGNQRAEA